MIITASGSDAGRLREVNQDVCAVRRFAGGEVLALVCDGMGGERGGNIASGIAGRVITEYVGERLGKKHAGQPREILCEALKRANAEIYKTACANDALRGMGTTAAAVLLGENNGQIHIVNVGDSRVYQVRGDGIRQLTRDHSVVQMMVENGEITESEARTHPKKHYITRAVGVSAQLEVDYIHADIAAGDRILICSDGFSNYFDIDEIYSLLHGETEELPQKLIDAANARGGSDNITAVVITKKD